MSGTYYWFGFGVTFLFAGPYLCARMGMENEELPVKIIGVAAGSLFWPFLLASTVIRWGWRAHRARRRRPQPQRFDPSVHPYSPFDGQLYRVWQQEHARTDHRNPPPGEQSPARGTGETGGDTLAGADLTATFDTTPGLSPTGHPAVADELTNRWRAQDVTRDKGEDR